MTNTVEAGSAEQGIIRPIRLDRRRLCDAIGMITFQGPYRMSKCTAMRALEPPRQESESTFLFLLGYWVLKYPGEG